MKRLLSIAGFVLLCLLLVVFLFISSIVKNIVEKNSEAWTGRKITIGSLWINIFGGSVHAKDFRILEKNSDSTFFRLADFYGNISLNQLLSGRYVLENIRIAGP